MELLNTEHKRKSAILTTIIMGMILFLIFFFGLKYLDPPEEYGIAVNFGTSDVGSGNTQSEPAPSSAAPQEVEEVEQEQVEELVEEVQEVQPTPTEPVSAPTKAEDVITNDNAESIKINKQKEAKRKAEENKRRKEIADQQRAEQAERAKQVAKIKAEQARKQKAAAQAAKEAKEKADKRKGIDNLLGGLNKGDNKGSGTGGTGNGGDGDDGKPGDKGSLDGTPYGNSYYGSGSGAGGYGLNGRNLAKKGQGFKQKCNEYGKVVVRIVVDKSGKVVDARPGVKGTTNTAPCLMAPAKKSAESFRWNADSSAPTKQIGFVIVSVN